jgi:ribosomal protein S16
MLHLSYCIIISNNTSNVDAKYIDQLAYYQTKNQLSIL